MQPTVISTFAGCGGSSLGYKWAGFHELLAIDFDKHAHECFKANFPEVLSWLRDVTTVSGKEILEACKIKQGELHVFDGSPPCQGFSTAGKRVVRDERNSLFEHFVRLIEELQPKVFLMENVSGQMKGKMKGAFLEILKALKATGYQVKCKLMNAMWYGVPQSRERLIYIGTRKDMPEPSFPEHTVTKPITVREALTEIVNKTLAITGEELKQRWNKMQVGENFSKCIGQAKGFSTIKVHPDKPCSTITKTVRCNMAGHLHYSEPRLLSIEELKRLASFPDNFKLHGRFEDQWARIGNAVMPKFMEAVARHIRQEILRY